MATRTAVLEAFHSWYGGLRGYPKYGGRPAKGAIAAALVVLERLRSECNLDLNSHMARGGAQIAGLYPQLLRTILRRYNETRDLPSEGGRTNRGNPQVVKGLLAALDESGFADLSEQDRAAALDEMQRFLVNSLDEYFKLDQISFVFDSRDTARRVVEKILDAAAQRQQAGPTAQHLVGAKLELRFPDKAIGNFCYSAADEQAGRQGDFEVGDTAFHVTVAPNMGHINRCKQNVEGNMSVYLLVPDEKVVNARVLLKEENIEDRVAVESIESFVGQNLSEMAEFKANRHVAGIQALLSTYNQRVSEVERDRSLLIKPPAGAGRERD